MRTLAAIFGVTVASLFVLLCVLARLVMFFAIPVLLVLLIILIW